MKEKKVLKTNDYRSVVRNSREHRLLAIQAANQAKSVLSIFETENSKDKRPREAIEALMGWAEGKLELGMASVRKFSLSSHAAAREAKSDAARFAARAAGQAVAIWHVPSHATAVPMYVEKATNANKKPIKNKNMKKIDTDTQKYNKLLSKKDREICDLLAEEINRNMPKAENKIWHANPVWFLDGNPIVGYGKLKDCVRLLFWSGQSFKEKGLQDEGSFKASEVRYTDVSQINTEDLKRWLEKSEVIQWDYKNIVKRKGLLKKIANIK